MIICTMKYHHSNLPMNHEKIDRMFNTLKEYAIGLKKESPLNIEDMDHYQQLMSDEYSQ